MLQVKPASYRLAGETRSGRIVRLEWTDASGAKHLTQQATSDHKTPVIEGESMTVLVSKTKAPKSAEIYGLSDYRAL